MDKNSFIENITSAQLRDALHQIGIADPTAAALVHILGPRRALEWAHTLGVCSYPELAGTQPEVPPASLREITAAPVPEAFLWRGINDAAMFADIYLRNGPTGLERRPRFLDFACGCGRIARYMQAWDCDLFACDMNPQLVEWCQSHLLETSTIQNQRNPPLDYPDGYFDFVYAYSVFTHTSEAATREWIHELRRVLIPGSLLAFTTNGSHWIDSVSKLAPVLKRMNLSVEELADAKSRVEQGEFVSHVYSGSPDGYGLALTSLGRIADSWVSSEFELVDQIPGGANHSQDMSVFRAK